MSVLKAINLKPNMARTYHTRRTINPCRPETSAAPHCGGGDGRNSGKGEQKNVVVDSAAIGPWHVGNRADPRAISTLAQHDLKCTHIVRQIKKQDFNDFDFIFGMDEDNMSELRRLAPKGSKAELLMLGDFGLDPKNRIIEDPYYQRGAAGFETAYQQCVVACAAFMKERLV